MNIYEKLIEVRKAVPYLQKENSGEQYNYVSSSQVLSKVRDEMDKQGLLLIPKVTDKKVSGDMVERKDKYGNAKHTTTYFTELNMSYIWVNAEKPEEKIECPWYGQGVDIAGEKGVGKALTYAEKYFLLKFFNIATDKDDPDSFQNKIYDDNNKNGYKNNRNDENLTVTDEMVTAMISLGSQKGVSEPKIISIAKAQFNKTNIKDLTKQEYVRLYKSLDVLKTKVGEQK